MLLVFIIIFVAMDVQEVVVWLATVQAAVRLWHTIRLTTSKKD
jgi:hypothetical protein